MHPVDGTYRVVYPLKLLCQVRGRLAVVLGPRSSPGAAASAGCRGVDIFELVALFVQRILIPDFGIDGRVAARSRWGLMIPHGAVVVVDLVLAEQTMAGFLVNGIVAKHRHFRLDGLESRIEMLRVGLEGFATRCELSLQVINYVDGYCAYRLVHGSSQI